MKKSFPGEGTTSTRESKHGETTRNAMGRNGSISMVLLRIWCGGSIRRHSPTESSPSGPGEPAHRHSARRPVLHSLPGEQRSSRRRPVLHSRPILESRRAEQGSCNGGGGTGKLLHAGLWMLASTAGVGWPACTSLAHLPCLLPPVLCVHGAELCIAIHLIFP
jgi:hypothetical protein